MSWDVLLLRLPPGITSLEELGDDFNDPLGTTDDVRSVLRTAVSGLDLTDPSWGVLDTPNYSIEFSIGTTEPCTAVMLHIRGEDDAVEPIRAICQATDWTAFDCSVGSPMDFDADPAKGLRSWREYRDKVIPGAPPKGVSVSTHDGSRVFVDNVGPLKGQPPAREGFWRRLWRRLTRA